MNDLKTKVIMATGKEDNSMDNNYEKIIFDTDDGEVCLFVLEQTMLGGINYLLVTEDADSEDAGFLILKETSEDGEYVSYDIVDDESELKSIISIFNELVDDFDLEV